MPATDIRLSVPFVNDTDYTDALIKLSAAESTQEHKIYEVYGSFPSDPVGNLRPPESIRPMTWEQLRSHIGILHRNGIRFNYILNSELLQIPVSKQYREEVLQFLQQLTEVGVDEVTVTVPYLISLIRYHFPTLTVNASICNEISSLKEAAEFEALGTSVIVMDRDANRDFSLLREIRKNISAGMKLLVNSACVYHCINVHYHGIYSSALSNTKALGIKTGEGSFPVPYCNYYCRHRFFSDPSELIRMHWIRPEDLHLYAKEGINLFKIDGRDKEPAYLLKVIRAYLSGHYEGNFFHLLQPEFCEDVAAIQKREVNLEETPERQTAAFLREEEDWLVGIRNSELDGFLQAFAEEKIVCRGNCPNCGYCNTYARRIVINPVWQQKMVRLMEYNLSGYYE